MKILYTVTGNVIEGKKRGRTLGFPTINIRLDQKIESGIYASYVYVQNVKYLAATFIGESKTFGESDYKLESYILDFDKDIYKETVKIELFKKIRNNEKYSSEEKLIEQIKNDVQKTRDFFACSGDF